MNSRKDDEPLNFGPVTSMWMDAIGIRTINELQATGLEETFRQLILHGFNANALMLYALEGRLTNTHWNDVPDKRKAELRKIAADTKKKISAMK
ncbi:MAG TPA: TfoX/Sxy family DNA transformation protein [Candidatus Kapabacteria bacterium]